MRALKRLYRRVLPGMIERPWWAVGALAAIFAATTLAVPFLGEEFMPRFKEYDFLMHWVEKPGTSLEAMQRITVRASRELRSAARVIERRVRAIPFERGYHPEFLGEYAAREEARNRLLALSGAALAGILLILHADFRSLRLVALLFVSLPFALVGGVASAFLADGVLSLGSLVGFVTVLGIAARNGIMLVSHYRHLEEREGMAFGPALILRGAEERLSPILMTALATGLALLPIALGGNKPGQEIEHPMAIMILGGLVTSTVLNLLLMPALHYRFSRRRGNRPTPQG